MNSIYTKTREIRAELSHIVGDTRVKSFFSYYAIFTQGLLFGLYKNEKFYLRLPEKLSREDLPHQLDRLVDTEYGIYDKNFYHIPNHILFSSLKQYEPLIFLSLEELSQQKIQAATRRKKLIRAMPNLNISIERLLKRLGIHTIQEFVEKGALEVYVEMIKRGIDADKNLLFRLYGAIHKQQVYMMNDVLKRQILRDANQALYDEGLRRRFKID